MADPHLRILVVLALASLACRGEADGASTDRSPAILPSMMRPQESNADASPPDVPFLATTPIARAVAHASFPHDTLAYTQGLLIHGARLLESTGREGQSELREVERGTGRLLRRTSLPIGGFGEGIAVSGGRVFQLTWKGGRGVAYDARSLAPVDSFTYAGEGWGLTSLDSLFYMSDGSAALRVIDPRGFRELRRIPVREGNEPVWMLNELEMVGPELWANVYETDLIARIDPATGRVMGWLDVGSLLTRAERAGVTRRGGVANGIAYDAARNVVLVTGKMWPRVFEIEVSAAGTAK